MGEFFRMNFQVVDIVDEVFYTNYFHTLQRTARQARTFIARKIEAACSFKIIEQSLKLEVTFFCYLNSHCLCIPLPFPAVKADDGWRRYGLVTGATANWKLKRLRLVFLSSA